MAQNDLAVVSTLGSPVEPGMFTTGNVNVNGSSGDADLAVPLHGSKGSGTLYIAGHKSAGRWSYSTLRVHVDKTGEDIDLVKSKEEVPSNRP